MNLSILQSRSIIVMCNYDLMIQSLDIEDNTDGILSPFKKRALGLVNSPKKMEKMANSPKYFGILTYIDDFSNVAEDVIHSLYLGAKDKLLKTSFKALYEGEILFLDLSINLGIMESKVGVGGIYTLRRDEQEVDYLEEIYNGTHYFKLSGTGRLVEELKTMINVSPSKPRIIKLKTDTSARKRVDYKFEGGE